AALMKMLDDAVKQIGAADDVQEARKFAALRLTEYIAKVDQYGPELERIDREEAQAILGKRYDDPAQLEEQLEAFVRSAGPEHNQQLMRFFASQIERRVQVYGDTAIGESASHVKLEPVY